jgi:hypothetical protein
VRRIFEIEFVADLRFELGMKDGASSDASGTGPCRVAQLRLLNSRSCKKADCCFTAALLLLDNRRLEELQRAEQCEHRFLLLEAEAWSRGSEAAVAA